MPRFATLALALMVVNASAAEAAPRRADTSERAADPREKIICKRFMKTGSLADSYRTCKTKGEWDRERENVRTINWSSPCNSGATGNCEG